MPLVKGKGKESRSRVGTPLPAESDDAMQGVQQTDDVEPSYSDILDRYCRGAHPPPSVQLQKIHDALTICGDIAKSGSDKFDKGMRETSQKRKEVMELAREQELEEAAAEEERKAQTKKQADQEARARPPAVGARSLAPQDGTDQEVKDENIKEEPEPAHASPTRSSSSPDAHQPRPAPAVPAVQTFGEDPSAFDDPTVYHIREVHAGLSEDEKKDILGVLEYPHDDLHNLTPGTPPDRDYSAGKVNNQVSWQQFSNYLEPYTRPLTQEDLAFLEERGDRVAPFVMPRRGARSYDEVWAEEDGRSYTSPDQPSDNIQPLGNLDQMSDETAEKGEVSAGPVLTRLLSALIPERRPAAGDNSAATNGDQANNQSTNRDADAPSVTANGEDQRAKPQPPASQMAEASQPGWKTNLPKPDYAQMDQRVLAELRHIGFIEEDAEPDYEGHHDDEVAARLRYLQEELERVSQLNNTRKARVAELAEEAIAKQEWSQIADDLDTQLNQAYLKRHRNIGKAVKHQKKRTPGAGGLGQPTSTGMGISKPGVGEQIKGLMDRREEWNDILGPIVDHGREEAKVETIFDEENMKRLQAREQDAWGDA